MWKWWESEKSGWSNFYLFLENTARTAKKQLTSYYIMSALSGDKGDKTKCSSCNKLHSGKCTKVKNTAALNQGNKKSCPVCDKSAHKYKTKAGTEGISKRIKDCPSFKAANDDQKQALIKKVKAKLPICTKYSGWSHKTEVCNWKLQCSKCNEVHINELCLYKKFFSCSLS